MIKLHFKYCFYCLLGKENLRNTIVWLFLVRFLTFSLIIRAASYNTKTFQLESQEKQIASFLIWCHHLFSSSPHLFNTKMKTIIFFASNAQAVFFLFDLCYPEAATLNSFSKLWFQMVIYQVYIRGWCGF